MTAEQIEYLWECGCNLAEIAAWLCLPESEVKRIVWNLIGCTKRQADRMAA